MNASHYLQIAMLTNNCPGCGSCVIDGVDGELIVKDNIYIRWCECGFRFEYDTSQGVTRNKIVKAIQEALREDKIKFCVKTVKELEGVEVDRGEFEKLTDEELDKKVERFEYYSWVK